MGGSKYQRNSADKAMSIYNGELHTISRKAVRFSLFFLLVELIFVLLTLVVIPSSQWGMVSVAVIAFAGFLGSFAVVLLVMGSVGLLVALMRHYYGFDRERVHHRVPTNTSIL